MALCEYLPALATMPIHLTNKQIQKITSSVFQKTISSVLQTSAIRLLASLSQLPISQPVPTGRLPIVTLILSLVFSPTSLIW